MFNRTCVFPLSALPFQPGALQRRRIAARVNVSPAVADVLALHAYGDRHEPVVLMPIADALTDGGQR